MAVERNKIYSILFLACLGGLTWVLLSANHLGPEDTSFCLVKNVSGLPCPSCGSTRSVLSLFHGDLAGAFYWNPLGFIITITMITAPLWILLDVIRKQDSLHRFYCKVEDLMRKKSVFIPSILMIAANWVWNIMKWL